MNILGDQLVREFDRIDTNLVSGVFYYLRAVVSEAIGAEVLVAYGLMRTGANQIKYGRQKTGVLLLAGGAAVAVHVITSVASAVRSGKQEL